MGVFVILIVMFVVCLFAVVLSMIMNPSFFVVQEQQAAIIERLGKFHRLVGPGLHFLLPLAIEQKRKFLEHDGNFVDYVDLKMRTHTISTQEMVTYDHIQLYVSAVIHYQITDPAKAVYAVTDVLSAIPKLCELIIRDLMGKMAFHEIFNQQGELSSKTQEHTMNVCGDWGITIRGIEFETIRSLGGVDPERPLQNGRIQHIHTYGISAAPKNADTADHVEVLLRRQGKDVVREEHHAEGDREGMQTFEDMMKRAQTCLVLWSQDYASSETCMQELTHLYHQSREGFPPYRIALITLDALNVPTKYAEISCYSGITREERQFLISTLSEEEAIDHPSC